MEQEIQQGIRWRQYIPTAILLLIIICLTVWSFLSGNAVAASNPEITLLGGLLLVIIGLVAGMLGGIIGTGGCSVMLPILHFWMGYPAPIAIGTTLFAVIFTALSGGWGHLVKGNLDKKAVLWLGGFGILGVLLGSWLFGFLTEQIALLSLILGIAFLLPAIRMAYEGLKGGAHLQEGATINGSHPLMGTFGFGIGILTGIVGVGGGYALVPGLIYLFGAPVYVTMGTSLATMIPLAIVGGSIKLAQGFVAIGAGLLLATGTIVGAQFGAIYIKRFKPTTLKLIFGVYFLYVALKFILNYFGIPIW